MQYLCIRSNIESVLSWNMNWGLCKVFWLRSHRYYQDEINIPRTAKSNFIHAIWVNDGQHPFQQNKKVLLPITKIISCVKHDFTWPKKMLILIEQFCVTSNIHKSIRVCAKRPLTHTIWQGNFPHFWNSSFICTTAYFI